MKSFYEKDSYEMSDIDFLINNEVEESVYLDFKEAGALDRDDKKRIAISKDVASFANSDGGIIVYGIKESNHKASAHSFIDGNEYTKEWLEQVITSNIQRHIPDLKIFPIRYENDIAKTIYIVKIPVSVDAPHISKDNKFYRRFNFQSVPMEEYEVRQLYGRKNKSELEIDEISIRVVESEDDNKIKFLIEVGVINVGNIVESSYKLNLYFVNYNPLLEVSWERTYTNYNYTIMEQGRVKISANGIASIYPNEFVNVIRVNCLILREKMLEVIESLKIEATLYYSNGEDKMDATIEYNPQVLENL